MIYEPNWKKDWFIKSPEFEWIQCKQTAPFVLRPRPSPKRATFANWMHDERMQLQHCWSLRWSLATEHPSPISKSRKTVRICVYAMWQRRPEPHRCAQISMKIWPKEIHDTTFHWKSSTGCRDEVPWRLLLSHHRQAYYSMNQNQILLIKGLLRMPFDGWKRRTRSWFDR